jgi:hypothetical protein
LINYFFNQRKLCKQLQKQIALNDKKGSHPKFPLRSIKTQLSSITGSGRIQKKRSLNRKTSSYTYQLKRFESESSSIFNKTQSPVKERTTRHWPDSTKPTSSQQRQNVSNKTVQKFMEEKVVCHSGGRKGRVLNDGPLSKVELSLYKNYSHKTNNNMDYLNENMDYLDDKNELNQNMNSNDTIDDINDDCLNTTYDANSSQQLNKTFNYYSNDECNENGESMLESSFF